MAMGGRRIRSALALASPLGSLACAASATGDTMIPGGTVTSCSSAAVRFSHALWALLLLACAVGVAVVPEPLWAAAWDLDPTFGTGGIVTGSGFPAAIALQADGRVVVISQGQTSLAGFINRYLANGTPDPHFGIGGRVSLMAPISSGSVQPDGKILVAGGASNALVLTRLEPDGGFDPTFGEDGTETVSFYPRSFYAAATVLQPDQRIIVGGTISNPGPPTVYTFAAMRFNNDGTPDRSFGSNGTSVFPLGVQLGGALAAAVLQPDGRLVLVGTAH